jgi:hypothetical protein
MPDLIEDIDECRIVIEQLIRRTALTPLVGPLAPDNESLCNLMHVHEGEEAEVELVDEHGQIVARLLVDVLDDPVNRWRIGLRGWHLCDRIASV